LPDAMSTDAKRLQQVLKNLLSNAFKFTDRGRVGLRVGVATSGWSADNESLTSAASVIYLAVSDTGIGIPKDKQQIIFEAFQQADGTTNRKYGGTGLGLSISREIARLLGGELRLDSTPGEGSTFTLFLPVHYAMPDRRPKKTSEVPSLGYSEPEAAMAGGAEGFIGATVEPSSFVEVEANDDRASLQEGDRVLLIVDDDANFARIILDLARAAGFKGLTTSRADRALALARDYHPQAIILDIRLADADGWTVLDRLKHDAATRHIPVYVISGGDEHRRAARLGAVGFLQKPATKEALEEALRRVEEFVTRPERRLLVVESDATRRDGIVTLIGNGAIRTTAVSSGGQAIEALKRQAFDCMILDPSLPDMNAEELLRGVGGGKTPELPVILYGAKKLSSDEKDALENTATGPVVKDATSPERLLDRTLLLLHQSPQVLKEEHRRMLESVRGEDAALAGRKVLIVDDDVRNIYALTTVLERYKMQVLYAESGRQGLAVLDSSPGIDIVLMDVMMPEMDGYETTRAIRRLEKFQNLPIIALTAKAMKGDREKCLAAGASEYIAKPVDTEHLCSVLRVWISK